MSCPKSLAGVQPSAGLNRLRFSPKNFELQKLTWPLQVGMVAPKEGRTEIRGVGLQHGSNICREFRLSSATAMFANGMAGLDGLDDDGIWARHLCPQT